MNSSAMRVRKRESEESQDTHAFTSVGVLPFGSTQPSIKSAICRHKKSMFVGNSPFEVSVYSVSGFLGV